MSSITIKKYQMVIPLLLLIGATAQAVTLNVNCEARAGFNSIGVALKYLQGVPIGEPNTINVSGACHENVVIHSLDRLTLTALDDASINDPSGGNLSAVSIDDSRDVTINGFRIHGGAAGGADAVDCLDGSLCRLNGNTVRGAVNGAGVGVYFSQLFLDGGTLRDNGTGLFVINGASAKATNVTIQNNSTGIEVRAQSFVNTAATIAANTGTGVFVHESGMLSCSGCQITGNGNIGVILRRDSSARLYGGYAVTGNIGGGIRLTEESSAYFPQASGKVTNNPGGKDVFCGSSFTTAKFATVNIGGGTTNCVEPSS